MSFGKCDVRLAVTIAAALMGSVSACFRGDADAGFIRAAEASQVGSLARANSIPVDVETAAALRYEVAPTGNEVRYRIREQLARIPLPNDAIGRTGQITGGISVATDGAIVVAESKFVVGTGSLASDSDRRDGFVKRRVLETDQFPTVEFVPSGARGLPRGLPTTGTHGFELIGNLTVRGVTRPTRWRVNATVAGGSVKGRASTAFTFADFNIAQPRVPVVLSVADTIRLEYDFSLVAKR
ncbi:MAG: YceI family protein [Gemmatimonadaceae bacterium]|nr:YceI family protein [Gemmatimonadaceae bacterium]